MDNFAVFSHFYPEDTPLRRMLLKHSTQVRDKALEIAKLEKGRSLALNRKLIEDGAMLHDIGISQCHAPSILCEGQANYIAHGIIGAEMLRLFLKEQGGQVAGIDLEACARICERHTGAGLTVQDIVTQKLPIPVRDFLPETLEEKLICLADKFFSKSGTMEEKPLPAVIRSMEKFGPETLSRLNELIELFL